MRGVFITFEGGEGSGKTTQIERLSSFITDHFPGISTCLTREPGGTETGEHIRTLLVNGAADRWQPPSEAMMMSAARHEHIVQVIRPALEAKQVVICDRFADSTYVYQGFVGGVDIGLLDSLTRLSCDGLTPDITFFLDLNSADGLARAAQRGGGEDRFEAKGAEFHERVREGFLQRAIAEPERIKRIDASRTVDDVAAEIAGHIKTLFAVRDIG
ncbi:MAG: dTMP kinase [Candidatus Puniceispirillum sp.]